MFQVGDQVRIRFSTLTGVVKDAEVDKTNLTLQYLVEYADKEGIMQMRYFTASDIEAV